MKINPTCMIILHFRDYQNIQKKKTSCVITSMKYFKTKLWCRLQSIKLLKNFLLISDIIETIYTIFWCLKAKETLIQFQDELIKRRIKKGKQSYYNFLEVVLVFVRFSKSFLHVPNLQQTFNLKWSCKFKLKWTYR